MGVAYVYLSESRVMVSTYWGVTTPAETRAMRARRAADPARAGAVAHVIDLSAFETSTATPRDEAMTFIKLGSEYHDIYGMIPTVVIAPRDHVFGLGRIFESVANMHDPDRNVVVVPSWEAAAEQLGMELAAARAAADAARRA
jgi:hypothetical protein